LREAEMDLNEVKVGRRVVDAEGEGKKGWFGVKI